MSILTNTALTYEAQTAGSTDDMLSRTLDVISPIDTHLWSAIKKDSDEVKQDKQEWLTRSLAAAAENAQLEGDQRTPSALSESTRIYNNHQILAKIFAISGSREKTSSPSNVNSEAYNVAEQLKLLAQDLEYMAWRGVRQDGATATARKARGALNWMTTNVTNLNGGTVAADGTISGGSKLALTKQMVKDTMQNCFVSGGKPTKLYAGPFQVNKISEFADIGNYRREVDKGKMEDYVDIYRSPTGQVEIITHRNFPTDVVATMDLSHWKKAIWRPVKKELVPSNIDGRVIDLRTECTVVARAEASSGRVVNLENS